MFIFLDTETTGTGTKDRLCQLAYKLDTGEIVNKLYKPPLPIEIEAMTVHHITNEMVADKPAFKDSPEYFKLVDLLDDDEIYLLLITPNLTLICSSKKVFTLKRSSVL